MAGHRSVDESPTRVEKRIASSEKRLADRLTTADTWGDQLAAVYDFARSALVRCPPAAAMEEVPRLIELLRATGRRVNKKAIEHARKEVRR